MAAIQAASQIPNAALQAATNDNSMSILRSSQCHYFLPNAGVAAIIAPGTVPNVKPAAEKHATSRTQ